MAPFWGHLANKSVHIHTDRRSDKQSGQTNDLCVTKATFSATQAC